VYVKIRIITASAGSGKTTRLSKVLDEAIATGSARPDAIVATTFTRQAAAELIERARARLLAGGHGREAHQLLAARIGTVNSVCGSLVTDFAFELGLSPTLRVLDESSAELEQKRALASIVDPVLADELGGFRRCFNEDLDWRQEVRKLIEAGRANGLDAAALRACGERSITSLDACLGPVAPDGAAVDRGLGDAIDATLASIPTLDATKGTAKYVTSLRSARPQLERGTLRWGDWAMLTSTKPCQKSRAAAAPVAAAAAQHLGHPRLRAQMHRLIRLLFDVAASGLTAYQLYKRERGVIDFVDQEALALQLLRRPDVRDALDGQLDLVLIDEFQDTSPLQLAIFLELASLARESVWVGDQKQAIYGFRGTDPALMDAVIESLTATTTDPDLVRTAVDTLADPSALETLSISYRSRPALVELTSDIFARAFAHHGMPEARTRLTPAVAVEPAGLGPIVEYWPLISLARSNKESVAAAAAAGVRDLLDPPPTIRDRQTGAPRPALAGDLAVLCRTNEQCQLVAEALAALDIPAIVPRMRLLDTAEGRLVTAALRLWVDPRDALARAELARLVAYASDLEALVAHRLATPDQDAFADDPCVIAILAARAAAADLDPVAVVTAVIDAVRLRELCAAWGSAAQRHANLDALRAHAVSFTHEALARRDTPSLVGLLAYLDEMIDEWSWQTSRSDHQALLGGSNAVTISTWHGAKGREWPVTVLYGLESLREPVAFGLHVESDASGFDVAAPLAGRWLRYWPNPYTTRNQLGPVKDAYAQSAEFAAAVARAEREALRLLYVGWTRARDRLILAAESGNLLGGLLGTLVRLDPDLISEPTTPGPGDVDVVWAGRPVALRVRPAAAAAAVARSVRSGEITIGLPARPYAPARVSPSAAAPVPCMLGELITIGPRIALRGDPDMEAIGHAVHGFLAADRPHLANDERLALAASLLERFGIASSITAPEVVAAATHFWAWIGGRFPGAALHREWPVAHRTDTGTLVAGTADLVIESRDGTSIVDHKTFPGRDTAALQRARDYSGQVAAYASAIRAATGDPITSTWIHFPVLGQVVQIHVLPTGAPHPIPSHAAPG
jgi:ATP-dependent helicase/nuclease subunit A